MDLGVLQRTQARPVALAGVLQAEDLQTATGAAAGSAIRSDWPSPARISVQWLEQRKVAHPDRRKILPVHPQLIRQ
jgi:hypothetical protein